MIICVVIIKKRQQIALKPNQNYFTNQRNGLKTNYVKSNNNEQQEIKKYE